MDDHTLLVHSLSRSLTDAGYVVVQAFNGDDALKHLNAGPFDFIVTDQFMPGKTGLDLVDYVCSQTWEMGIILITSHHDNQPVLTRVRAYAKAAVMVKPVSASNLLAQLSQLKGAVAGTAPGGIPVIRP